MATTYRYLQAPHGSHSVYANLSRDEFETKISRVQTDIREFMNELPSCKQDLGTRYLIELIDEEIDGGTSVLEENRRRVCVTGDSPAAETRSIKMKIALKKLEQDVDEMRTFRAECILNEESRACSAKREDDEESGLDVTTVAPSDDTSIDGEPLSDDEGGNGNENETDTSSIRDNVSFVSPSHTSSRPSASSETPAVTTTCTRASLPEQEIQDTPEVTIKPEMKCVNDVTRDKRQYGDRFLLGRQDPKGIMRLGGNGQDTYAKPRKDHPRLQTEIGNLEVCCYSDIWQSHFAPQYAGSNGCVDRVPRAVRDGNAEFALFMRRSLTKFGPDTKIQGPLLGWEYCGNYMLTPGGEDIEITESALSFSVMSKKNVAKKLLVSSKRDDGYGRRRLDYWRSRLQEETKRDKSPPGPKWMIERRSPSHEEKNTGPYPLAARARALGYKTDISDEKLAHLIVELDEYHTLCPITFVKYQEAVYDYVKGGKTCRNAEGRKCSQGAGSAKTSDWYSFLDTLSF